MNASDKKITDKIDIILKEMSTKLVPSITSLTDPELQKKYCASLFLYLDEKTKFDIIYKTHNDSLIALLSENETIEFKRILETNEDILSRT